MTKNATHEPPAQSPAQTPAQTPPARQCIFCAIAAGTAPSRRVSEDEHTYAFLDVNPAAPGHTLVVPKVHATDLTTIDPDLAGHVFAAAARVSRHLTSALGADGLTVVQTNGRAGWQDVFHLHVHLVPRWAGDNLTRPWTPRRADPTELDAMAQRLIVHGQA